MSPSTEIDENIISWMRSRSISARLPVVCEEFGWREWGGCDSTPGSPHANFVADARPCITEKASRADQRSRQSPAYPRGYASGTSAAGNPRCTGPAHDGWRHASISCRFKILRGAKIQRNALRIYLSLYLCYHPSPYRGYLYPPSAYPCGHPAFCPFGRQHQDRFQTCRLSREP